MRFTDHLNSFTEYLETKNFSERTVSSYTFESKKFLEFLTHNYPRVRSIGQVTKDIINDFSNYLSSYKDNKGKSLSSKTQKLKLTALKKFFFFLLKNDFVVTDPTSSLELPKEGKEIPRSVLTEKETFKILTSIDTKTPIGLRNKAVAELFYSCGVRTSEICNIKIHDVDLKEQTVLIAHGKGDKMRLLPLTQQATFYIEQYLLKARKFMLKGKIKDEGYLFLSSRGRPFDRSTLNKCVIAQITKGLGIKKRVTAYTFRHSIATHMIQNKIDIRFVQQLLGHESLKTTAKYCHLDISDLKKMHSLYHPRDKV